MNSKSKSVATTTVGYMSIALVGWMISMSNAAWFAKLYPDGQALLYPMTIILAVMGILSFFQDRALDAIVFFGAAGLFWSDYLVAGNSAAAAEPHSYVGWFAIIWAVFFFYVWLGSFKSGVWRMLFLLGLWLTLLALAIGDWGNVNVLTIIGGYIGLVTSILAGVVSCIDVIGYGAKGNPNTVTSAAATPMAAD